MFFVISFGKMTREDMVEAMFMLSYYHVHTRMYSDGSNATSAYMVVEEHKARKDAAEDLRLAEMTFQMAFHTDDSLVCPHCAGIGDDKPKDNTCGHFNFVKQIKPAF